MLMGNGHVGNCVSTVVVLYADWLKRQNASYMGITLFYNFYVLFSEQGEECICVCCVYVLVASETESIPA